MNNLPTEYHDSGRNQNARQSDQKFCHACARVLHSSAASCPSCGAAQQVSAVQVNSSFQSNTISNASYCHGCGQMLHASADSCPKCGARQSNYTGGEKSRITAGLLALLLGGIGVHKFYCGKNGLGILYLLFFWTWIPMIVAFFEAIIYFMTSNDQEFTKKYCS